MEAADASEAPVPPENNGSVVAFDYRAAFEQVAEEYPAAGCDRTKHTQAVFIATVASEHKRRDVPPAQVCSEIVSSIRRYREEDFRWQSGRVHLLRTFLEKCLFHENPLPAAEQARARAPGPPNGSRGAARRELLRNVKLEPGEEDKQSHASR